MKISILGAAILATFAITSTASAQQADVSLKLADLKQAISHIEQSDNQTSDEISVSIRNDRVRVSSDHREAAPGVISFDVYRIGAGKAPGVFDQGARLNMGDLKAQLNQASQAKADSIKISGQTVAHLAELRGLVQSLAVADSTPVEFNLTSKDDNGWTFAVPGTAPAALRVYSLVNYREKKAK